MEKKAKNIISLIQARLLFVILVISWVLSSNISVNPWTYKTLLFSSLATLFLGGIRALDDNFSK